MSIDNILRRYPIRKTRNKWEIKLFSQHVCNNNCIIRFMEDENNPERIIIYNNPKFINGKCEYCNSLTRTYIRFAFFDPNNCYISDNEILHGFNDIVIPDKRFRTIIHYPLSHYFEVIVSTDEYGFTLKKILNYIKNLYEYIYEEEERTATPQTYQLKKYCMSCGNKDLDKYAHNVVQENNSECSICYNDYHDDKNAVKLKCDHIFHNSCIKTWFENSGTCPICRSNVFECTNCNGNGIIYYQFVGIVIPIEERGININRNYTNGSFGIYNYDLEDLFIESLIYDRKKKNLHINIIS